MFVAHEDQQFPLPAGLSEPGTTLWRSVHLLTASAWYALTIRTKVPVVAGGTDEIELQRTFLFSWSSDVAAALKEVGEQTLELLCIAQGRGRRSTVWLTHRIADVWHAVDADGNAIVVFVCDDGTEITGLLAEPSHKHKRTELIARIKPRASVSKKLQ